MRTQQLRIYTAEQEVMPLGRTFRHRGEIQRYVDDLLQEPWVGEQYPDLVFIEVNLYSSSSSASCGALENMGRTGYIEMHSEHHSEGYVLHELAHVLAAMRFKSTSHDPGFARIFLELVYRKIGQDAWLALRSAFERHDIDWNADDGS